MAGTSNWNLDETYEQMIFSYKGYKQCQAQRAALMLCRATPYGKHVKPEHCEKEAANLLECYHQTGVRARRECDEQYKRVFECLKAGGLSKWGHTTQGVCSKLLDDFAKC